MEILNYHNLFAQITGLTERYRNINEITGEDFNLFRILKIESAEVRTHSALIGELLNPRGSHGQKDTFLKLFIDTCCPEGFNIDSSSCNVTVEKYIGGITEDRLNGGRLDIFISDKNGRLIIIENKIYAQDEDNQLIRYSNHSKNAAILYLTLDGRAPTINSCGTLQSDIDYKCVSYGADIINWLNLCRKETVLLPIIRESITQYINLIKYLTNQTLNHAMQEEIVKVIKANMQASIIIADNLKNAQSKILSEFKEALRVELLKRGLELNYDVNLKNCYNGFYISNINWHELRIAFQFQAADKELIYGIATIHDPLKIPITPDLMNQIGSLPDNTELNNKYWAWLRPMEEPFDNWHNLDTWNAIINGEMLQNVLDKVDDLIKKVKESNINL